MSYVPVGYANIFMDRIESNRILPSQFGAHIRAWHRFVDYIVVLWTGSEELFNEFTDYINGLHELLEFTVTKNEKQVHFLDIEIIKDNERVHTTMYTKPTDKNNLLEKNRFHAPKTFRDT